MGTIQHDAILITCWQDEAIQAIEDFLRPKDIAYLKSEKVINAYRTIVIPPDGSKEGWEESNKMDEVRKRITEFLVTLEAKSLWAEWVHVTYGERGDWTVESSV